MLKNILNLNGAQQLSKNDQSIITGGWAPSRPFIGSGCRPVCPSNCGALGGECVPCVDGPVAGFECKIF